MSSSEFVLSPHSMEKLAERIEAEMGLSFPAAKRRDLHGAVRRMAESQRFDDDEACIDWLLHGGWSKEKTDLCAHYLTIGETYFFREPRAFELVCDYARKKRANAGGGAQLRIWSAGCCTGEEPYSIAMALDQVLPAQDSRAISILATDINSRHLRFARAGVYRQWSFRNTDAAMQRLNFSEEGDGRFLIDERIRKQVRFSELNLASPVYPSVATGTHAMDIIFCRNVLMYFSRLQAKNVIKRFRQCLVDGGWLIVSPSEASAELFAGFAGVYFPDAIYFQKSALHEQVRAPLRAVPAADPIVPEATQIARVSPAADKTAKPEPEREAGADPEARARALVNAGDAAEALRCLRQALENGPPTAELYHAKALIAMELGDRRAALDDLKRVLYLKPDFILAHYLMGVLQSAQNRHSEASRHFETASELLAALEDEAVVPGSDGLPAAYLRESIRAYRQKGES